MASVRETLRDSIKACAKEITTAAGYNYTYAVFDPPINMEQINQYPCVNIKYGQFARNLESGRHISNSALLDIETTVEFHVFISEQNDPIAAQSKVVADFQKYFGNNYYVKPTGESRSAFEILYSSDDLYGTDRTAPNFVIVIKFDLYFSQRLNNPDIMV